MNAYSFFERLREKPKEVRVRFSLLCALCVTGVVGLLWGATLPARLVRVQPNNEASKTAGDNLNSFLSDARSNLAEVIGVSAVRNGTGDAPNPALPAGSAYVPGAPAQEQPGYYDSPFQGTPPVVPVARKEVRLGTTTSGAARVGQ